PGGVGISAGLAPARTDNSIVAILQELDKLVEGIPDEEVTRAKDFWKGRMELRLEETRSLASLLGSRELLLNRIYTLEEVVAQIDAVKHDDLLRVAAASFTRPR